MQFRQFSQISSTLTLELRNLNDFLKLPSLSIPLSIYIYGDLAVTAANIFKTKSEAKR